VRSSSMWDGTNQALVQGLGKGLGKNGPLGSSFHQALVRCGWPRRRPRTTSLRAVTTLPIPKLARLKTCRRSLRTSVYRGQPEVAGHRQNDANNPFRISAAILRTVLSEQKERLRAVFFWGVCEMVHIRGARALLVIALPDISPPGLPRQSRRANMLVGRRVTKSRQRHFAGS